MKLMQQLLVSIISAFVIAIVPIASAAAQAPAPAQTLEIEVSEVELNRFANAISAVQEIQLRAQERIEVQIGDSKLEERRFQEIHSAALNPQIAMPADLNDLEQQAYQDLLETIVRLEQEAQSDMQSALQSEGLELNRFNKIATAVQQDPELFSELQARME